MSLASAATEILLNRIIDATSAKPKSGGGYMGHCPAHDDRNPSLSIDVVDDRVLVKCWSGCAQGDVIDSLRSKGAWHDEREAARVRSVAAKVERADNDQSRRNKAAVRGRKIYDAANSLDPLTHPYVIAKGGVPLGEKVRRGQWVKNIKDETTGEWSKKIWGDALLIPIYDSEKRLTSLQAINVDGEKDFLAGGMIKGCFCPVGKITGAIGQVFIGEGLATVAAVVHVMGGGGVVALNAGNLGAVVHEIKQLAPDAKIIILADDDQKDGSDTNPGIEAAEAAAAATCSLVALPGMGKKADFWDVWHELGPVGVKAAIDRATYIAVQPKEKPAPVEDEAWFRDAVRAGSVARFIDNPKPELDFVFADSLLSATVGLLVGPGAAGKSTLSILMLMAVATGRDILPGIFTPTRAGRVLGIFAEDCEEILHHSIKTISDTLFFFDREALALLRENMCVVSTPGHDLRLFDDAQRLKAATEFYNVMNEVATGIDGLRLMVIDPLSRFHGAEENDNGAGTYFVSLLEKIAQKTRAAVLCLHHVGKRSGFNNNEFSLDAAMNQDVARGASGLTNGVRWQCNLFGIPEKSAKNIIGVKDANPGQFLALRVSKKNYGKPEPVHFLERGHGGMLKPVEPIFKDGCGYDLENAVLKLVLGVVALQLMTTKRMLADAYHADWKKDHPELSRAKLDNALASFVAKGRLTEVEGKNKSGKTIWVLTQKKTEPDEPYEPDKVPEGFEPYEPDRTGQTSAQFSKSPESYNKVKPDKSEPDEYLYSSLSARNYGTVEPDKVTPYGGSKFPSGSPGRNTSPMPIESKKDESSIDALADDRHDHFDEEVTEDAEFF
jgi:phage/plasmid primase-like uncharacterized protein